MTRRLRHPVAGTEEAPAATSMSMRTRLRVSAADQAVINSLGRQLAHLAGSDLKARVADGGLHSADTWAKRKRGIARESSSR